MSKVLNDTYYHQDTPWSLVRVLERCRRDRVRIRFHYGDPGTGRLWGELYGVEGRLGRSMGPKHIPILLYNTRSIGGGGILGHCTLKVEVAKGKKILWTASKYETPDVEILLLPVLNHPTLSLYTVIFNGQPIARSASKQGANAIANRLR